MLDRVRAKNYIYLDVALAMHPYGGAKLGNVSLMENLKIIIVNI